jgi:hypothetical protein
MVAWPRCVALEILCITTGIIGYRDGIYVLIVVPIYTAVLDVVVILLVVWEMGGEILGEVLGYLAMR